MSCHAMSFHAVEVLGSSDFVYVCRQKQHTYIKRILIICISIHLQRFSVRLCIAFIIAWLPVKYRYVCVLAAPQHMWADH